MGILLAVLAVLWILGYVRLPGVAIPDWVLFSINGRAITLWSVLIFLAIIWALSLLPAPVRQVAAAILILWLLSVFGILAITGLPSILVIAVIAAIIWSMAKA